ncbi:site-specific DNA-methyltransferase [Micrococcus luteus]|uniref:site-specific DNA-methyltransferase n=1 Tax=Micrococcus luteus TaxID=1270 RepID=UPI001C23C083|nr:site-specific DNA-methyltransferase [Micrococcus luteus]MBU8742047.1 site-specific DNA-methyltransferase [Micrococcus luteus]MCV7597462.1 site-specific DNA-methyltransferase [Micrococcus luteus]MCV7719050.1 site-specific DNA-methyltransferase [Micrococcus luteus]MCV7721656.1 site-specific DNA-methyltransferase [Micrococcus luteus]
MTDEIYETPSTTPNFQTELAAQLADLIPEAIADGKVDVEKLKELLDGDAADSSERFGLFWPGKKRALRAAQEPTTATLKPDFENSKDWDTTKNVFIEGDNLEVLKILQKHYHAKIKLIYIDPPYNTGNDFVYPDNYKEGLDTYLEWTRQVNEEGKKVTTNAETEGRYHSNWLNMMYPRLKLARNLLTDDGVLFISIDDNEFDNLSRLCKELFGEDNFSTTFIRQKKKKPSFLHSNVGSMTEYVVCVTRNKNSTFPFSVDTTTAGKKYPLNNAGNSLGRLTFPAGSVRFAMADGVVAPQDMSEGKIITRLTDELVIENGVNKNAFTLEGEWRYSQSRLDEIVEAGEQVTISKIPFRPNHVKVGGEVKKMHNLLTPDTYKVGTNEDGTEEVSKLLGGDYFDNPKPSSLVRVLTQAVTYDDPQAIVLDFFAGSGTTAHAVMALNAEDGGARRSIVVQLPEPVLDGSDAFKAGYRTISEISRARIKAAAAALEASRAGQLDDAKGPLDTGFRAYRLADTNFVKWRLSSDVAEDALQQHLLSLRDSATDDATADDLLTEILLKQGYSLTEAVSPAEVAGLDVRLVRDTDGDVAVVAYLNEHVKPTLEQLRALVDKSPTRIIVLEDAFQGDDELKTNLAQLAKSKGIELWTA